MVDLVVNRHVDVINMSIGGLPALNDANNARAELYDKLINDYGVQLFISAGNEGPGVNTIGDPSVATNVVSVAASVTKETWLANYGSVDRKDTRCSTSRPAVRARTAASSRTCRPGLGDLRRQHLAGRSPGREAGYTLPIGYAMENGTSMASRRPPVARRCCCRGPKAHDLGITRPPCAARSTTTADRDPGVGRRSGQRLMDVNGAGRSWPSSATRASTRRRLRSARRSRICSPRRARARHLQPLRRGCGGLKAVRSKTYTVKLTRTSGPSRASAQPVAGSATAGVQVGDRCAAADKTGQRRVGTGRSRASTARSCASTTRDVVSTSRCSTRW
jgi:hypothetical protein